MADSLRLRLLAWHLGMVMLVLASVAVAVCWVTWQTRLNAVDDELRTRAASVSSAVQPGAGGGFDVELSSEATAYFQASRTRPYYAVWSASGALVDRSDPEVAGAAAPAEGAQTVGNRREIVLRRDGLTILVGRDISDIWQELWSLALTMIGVAAAAIATALAGAWLLAGRALMPMQRINETARRMAGGDLTARIAVDHTETELGQVALALNLAFDRLRASIERQRQFTADASHQLRTPVATMMAELEWALKRERPAEQYRESLETCHRAGCRMQSLVNGLLTLARADNGELPAGREKVRIDRLAADVVDALRPLALRHEVTIDTTLEPTSVAGDPERLRDLLSNLLFNAITYNRRRGTVSIEVRHETAESTELTTDYGEQSATEYTEHTVYAEHSATDYTEHTDYAGHSATEYTEHTVYAEQSATDYTEYTDYAEHSATEHTQHTVYAEQSATDYTDYTDYPERSATDYTEVGGGWALIRVRDSGIGIGTDDLPHVFDRFFRAEPARALQPAGAGLGLALAQWIATVHGGSIGCTSEPGVFAEFVVRLPAAAHAVAAADPRRLKARFAKPPATPSASSERVTAGVQIDARPSAASSE